MNLILGTKESMTQIFTEDGRVHPATVIKTDDLTVTQVKTEEKDGYTAVQFGYGSKKEKNTNSAQKGHFKKAGETMFEHVKEMRTESAPEVNVGDTVNVADVFSVGDKVMVSGISKGKGFQGVVKRHGFHGGPRTHGQKHNERSGGSIGAKGPARVFKGRKMPGHMGAERVSVKNLKVLAVDKENNQLIVEGAVPGRRGTLIEVTKRSL